MNRRDALRVSAGTLATALGGCLTAPRTSSTALQPTERWQYELPAPLCDFPAFTPHHVYLSTTSSVVELERETGSKTWDTFSTDAPIAVAPDTLFIWSHLLESEFQALDLDTYTPRWQFDRLHVMPTVHNETAYVTEAAVYDAGEEKYTSKGGIHAVDLQSGERHWRFVAGDFELPSVVTDETVYVWATGSTNSNESGERPVGVYALNAPDGREQWRFETETPWGPTRLAGETLVVGSDSVRKGPARIYGVDPSTGVERWRFEREAGNAFPTTVMDTQAFILTWDDEGPSAYALDAAIGMVQWHVEQAIATAVYDDLVYLDHQDGTVSAATSVDGREQWRFSPPTGDTYSSMEWSSSVELVGMTLFVVNGRTLSALDAVTGEKHWQFTAPVSLDQYWMPTETDIYVATETTLYALTPPFED